MKTKKKAIGHLVHNTIQLTKQLSVAEVLCLASDLLLERV
jgi:hypothetical protein